LNETAAQQFGQAFFIQAKAGNLAQQFGRVAFSIDQQQQGTQPRCHVGGAGGDFLAALVRLVKNRRGHQQGPF
jgi:hypothetical protein